MWPTKSVEDEGTHEPWHAVFLIWSLSSVIPYCFRVRVHLITSVLGTKWDWDLSALNNALSMKKRPSIALNHCDTPSFFCPSRFGFEIFTIDSFITPLSIFCTFLRLFRRLGCRIRNQVRFLRCFYTLSRINSVGLAKPRSTKRANHEDHTLNTFTS